MKIFFKIQLSYFALVTSALVHPRSMIPANVSSNNSLELVCYRVYFETNYQLYFSSRFTVSVLIEPIIKREKSATTTERKSATDAKRKRFMDWGKGRGSERRA